MGNNLMALIFCLGGAMGLLGFLGWLYYGEYEEKEKDARECGITCIVGIILAACAIIGWTVFGLSPNN